MRYFIACFVVILAITSLFSEEVELQPLTVEPLTGQAERHWQRHQEQQHALEERFRNEMQQLAQRSIQQLKRTVNTRSTDEERMAVYLRVLELDMTDSDAITYFTSIGKLAEARLAITPRDLLGNPIGEVNVSPLPTTAAEWDALEGQVFVINLNESRLTIPIAIPEGRSVRIIPHPTDVSTYVPRGTTRLERTAKDNLQISINGEWSDHIRDTWILRGPQSEINLRLSPAGWQAGTHRIKIVPVR